MKRLLYLLAAVAVLFTACKKDPVASNNDLVGVWEDPNDNSQMVLTFNKDGSYTITSEDFKEEGTWTLDKGILTTLNHEISDGEDVVLRADYTPLLIGGKAALVLRNETEDEVYYELYYKKGATVKSGALKDGRYDAPHNGIKGTGNYDRTITFIVKGNQLDLYVHAWGTHLQGTYTIENGYLKFNATKGWYGQDMVEGGWFAGDADIDFENFTFGNENYQWLEGMQYQDVFSSFPLCVTDDGKDAYMSAAGLTRWLFLR